MYGNRPAGFTVFPHLRPTGNIGSHMQMMHQHWKETTMLNRFILCLVTSVLFAGLLHAHGDPIMGTVPPAESAQDKS